MEEEVKYNRYYPESDGTILVPGDFFSEEIFEKLDDKKYNKKPKIIHDAARYIYENRVPGKLRVIDRSIEHQKALEEYTKEVIKDNDYPDLQEDIQWERDRLAKIQRNIGSLRNLRKHWGKRYPFYRRNPKNSKTIIISLILISMICMINKRKV